MKQIQNAIDFIHGIGLCHNDINLSNIMLDSDLNVKLIDFDSCAREGEPLLKVGTPDWMDNTLELSSKDNDLCALRKVKNFITRGSQACTQ